MVNGVISESALTLAISRLIASEAAADVDESFILPLRNEDNHMAQRGTGPRPSAGRVSDGKRLWLQSREAPDSQSESRPHNRPRTVAI